MNVSLLNDNLSRHFRITFISLILFFSCYAYILVKPCFALKKNHQLAFKSFHLVSILHFYPYKLYPPSQCFFLISSRYSTSNGFIFIKHTQTHKNTSFFISLSIYLSFSFPQSLSSWLIIVFFFIFIYIQCKMQFYILSHSHSQK